MALSYHRFGRDHFDDSDVIIGFGAATRPSLAELAALCGIPAKGDGIAGTQVDAMALRDSWMMLLLIANRALSRLI
jgi:hypothetical protein